jgi:hypothetical protein
MKPTRLIIPYGSKEAMIMRMMMLKLEGEKRQWAGGVAYGTLVT